MKHEYVTERITPIDHFLFKPNETTDTKSPHCHFCLKYIRAKFSLVDFIGEYIIKTRAPNWMSFFDIAFLAKQVMDATRFWGHHLDEKIQDTPCV